MTTTPDIAEIVEKLESLAGWTDVECDFETLDPFVVRQLAREAAAALQSLQQDNAALREALKAISRLRPLGDLDTCKRSRALVGKMEIIALDALARSVLQSEPSHD